MPTFSQKNTHSLNNTLRSCPDFVYKSSILSKTHCSDVFFIKFGIKKQLLSCPNLVLKKSILSKLRYIMGHKDNRIPLFFKKFPKIPYNYHQKMSNATSKCTIISNKKRHKHQKSTTRL